MKYTVLYKPFGNTFFFLASLARHRTWYRPEYNKVLLNKIILTGEERTTLRKFQRILARYPIAIFDNLFIEERRCAVQKLQPHLSSQDYQDLQYILNSFTAKFGGVLPVRIKEKEVERTVVGLFEKLLYKNWDAIEKVMQDLTILYGQPKTRPTIFISLIVLPSHIHGGGGKYSSRSNLVILEGSLKRLGNQRSILLLLHELIHLAFERGGFTGVTKRFAQSHHNLLIRIFGTEMRSTDPVFILREAVARSLLPYGYLQQKYFPVIVTPKTDANSSQEAINTLWKTYLDHKQAIDAKFLKQFLDLKKKEKEALTRLLVLH
jgi:hypothetical protein